MALAHQSATDVIPEHGYRRYLFLLCLGMVFLGFLAAPWSFSHKAHVALHGLCAQIPSHTLRIGNQPLPFDSRMTGIYGGFLVSAAYLCLRGRYRSSRTPSLSTIAILALFVLALAVDGTNSFLLDMGMWHPYEPDNRLRLATGLLTGISLAAAVVILLALTLWRRPDSTLAVVRGPGEILALVALQAPFAASCLFGMSAFYIPLVLFLLLAAVLALTALMISSVVMFRCLDGQFTRVADVQGIAVVALFIAIGIMVAFSGGRFLLEHFYGPTTLT